MRGEGTFNPAEEYELIRALPEGQEREAQKRSFHERRIEQKIGIATLAALLVEQVMDNPDVTENELKNAIMESAPELELSGSQKKMFNLMINEYQRRRDKIHELQRIADDPAKVFKKKFGRSPKHPVKIIFGPIVTHFILSDFDYDEITNEGKDGQKAMVRSAGQFSPLRDDITISRRVFGGEEKIRRHEETHALKHMLDHVMGIDRFGGLFREDIRHQKKRLMKAKDPRVKEYIARQILRGYIY